MFLSARKATRYHFLKFITQVRKFSTEFYVELLHNAWVRGKQEDPYTPE